MRDYVVSKKVSVQRIEKIFPDCFSRFVMPAGAHEESIKVYRGCKSGKCDSVSFTPSYMESESGKVPSVDENDPGLYSLSTFEKPKDIKRFAEVMSDMSVPCKIAVGYTNPIHGLVQRTKERTKTKTSHVDWWLYKDAKPYIEFEIIEDFYAYFDNYKKDKSV